MCFFFATCSSFGYQLITALAFSTFVYIDLSILPSDGLPTTSISACLLDFLDLHAIQVYTPTKRNYIGLLHVSIQRTLAAYQYFKLFP